MSAMTYGGDGDGVGGDGELEQEGDQTFSSVLWYMMTAQEHCCMTGEPFVERHDSPYTV